MYILGIVFTLLSSVGFAKIDESAEIFFPPSLKYLQKSQTDFPVFWWNFLVIEPKNGKPAYSEAEQICIRLKNLEAGDSSPQAGASGEKPIKHIMCDNNLSGYLRTLGEWSRDIVLREKFDQLPGLAESQRAMVLDSLTQLSLMSSSEKSIWTLKRRDPLDQWQSYLEKSQAMSPSSFRREQGVLVDPASQRIVIPIQFSGAPKMAITKPVMQELQNFEGTHLVGGHGVAFSNESQIHKDLTSVSLVGLLVLVGFVLFLVLKGRVGALLLLPPVAISVGLAAWVVELLFGSIHGLTLAFGSGIVGLVIDYGLHGAFNSKSHMTWRSNSVGFLTTFVALAILAFSQIPLLRQMMIFSALGIFFGFLTFYLFCRFLPKLFNLEPIIIQVPNFKGNGVLICLLVVCGIFGAGWSQLNFDLRDFNFQPAADSQAMKWFFSQGPSRETFLTVHDKTDFDQKTAFEKKWSDERQIQYVGLGGYLPSIDEQKKNQASWHTAGCKYFRNHLSVSEVKVFSPFLEDICRVPQQNFDFSLVGQKSYLRDLVGMDQFVSLLFAKDSEQAKQIRDSFPAARSLREAVGGFSAAMHEDLQWMIPTILILCTLILGLHYKGIFFVFSAYIPFLSGMGLFFIAKFLLNEHIDLISILGLLMVFGFSIDYGVFVTDIFAFRQDPDHLQGVRSVLSLAAMTNVIGFFPLILAKHPILYNLGSSLFFGTIGAYLGTCWGVERFLRLKDVGRGKVL
ncbi:MAG: hypothetical protein JNM39_18405 [Bdellovibrionaceae bacterium]|nr:hypothetical protein [Pseudobdellovibrionaceae bacterium]